VFFGSDTNASCCDIEAKVCINVAMVTLHF
jgi:hypothetical protein